MKFALCNEMFEGKSIAQICPVVRQLGYHGVEIAPFTLEKSAGDVSAGQRRRICKAVADNGLEVVGLHWLLAGSTGLHMTAPDNTIRRKTADYFKTLIDLCDDLGGKVLVIGSPKQRSLVESQSFADGWNRAVELFQSILDLAQARDVYLCIEPLSPVETNFINTVEEGLKMVRELNHPNFKIHLDVKAMYSENIAVSDVIRSVQVEDVGHFHVNDPNLYGPGMGNVDYAPIAAAINDIGWDKWLSVEVFMYDPDPETIAGKSVECLKSFWNK